MANQVPARLTAGEGRKFGLTVGLAFLAIAGFLWWRGRVASPPWIGGLGAVLVLAGLLIPTRLGPVQRAWMALAHAISKVTTPIFMGVIYFLVITPTGVLMRLAGRRQLVHPKDDGGFWARREPGAGSMERQF